MTTNLDVALLIFQLHKKREEQRGSLGKEPETGAKEGSDSSSTRADLESVGAVTRTRAGTATATRTRARARSRRSNTRSRSLGSSSRGSRAVSRRSSLSVLSRVDKDTVNNVHHTVLGNVVARNDLGSNVTRGNIGTGRVGGKLELVTRSRDGGQVVPDASRVDDGSVENVVQENSSLLGRVGSLNSRLNRLNGLVGRSKDGDDRVVQRLNKVGALEEGGELRSAKLGSNGAGVAGDGEDLIDRLNADVLVLRTVRGERERNVARSELDVVGVVASVLGENDDLASVAGKRDVLGRVEGRSSDGLVAGADLAVQDGTVEDCCKCSDSRDMKSQSYGFIKAPFVSRRDVRLFLRWFF